MTNTYTPTTEWVITGWMKARASDGVTADVAIEEINRWLAEVKAQAWEEGYGTGWGDGNYSSNDDYNNPYRQGEDSENLNSQPAAETPNCLNLEGEEQ